MVKSPLDKAFTLSNTGPNRSFRLFKRNKNRTSTISACSPRFLTALYNSERSTGNVTLQDNPEQDHVKLRLTAH